MYLLKKILKLNNTINIKKKCYFHKKLFILFIINFIMKKN